MMNPVVHFELPYDDQERMIGFYEKTFGWKANRLGPSMGNYVTVATSELDEKTKFPKKPGMINGGLFARDKEKPGPGIVIGVDDIRDAMKKVEEAGGKIIGGMKPGEPDDIPGVGLYISFQDTEGNLVGIIQPKGM